MENIVHAVHGIPDRGQIPDISDEELDLSGDLGHGCLKLVAHIVLLLLIPGEDADLPDIGFQKPVQHRIAKGAGAACDQKGLSRKQITHNCQFLFLSL